MPYVNRHLVIVLSVVTALCSTGSQARPRPSAAAVGEAKVVMEPIIVPFENRETLAGGVWRTENTSPGAPLILLSHGGGGTFDGHADLAQALARAGFIVAAVNHAGDTLGDEDRVLELWRRPRQLSRLIDYMLGSWPGHALIDDRRIGAFGFSNGGFTVLVSMGAVPELSSIEGYCRANPTHDICTALKSAGVGYGFSRGIPPGRWLHDARIRAGVVAAPAFGFAFDKAGMANVRNPVQLWGGSADRHQPPPFYEDIVRRYLPVRPEWHRVAGAGHYDFLPPCSAGMSKAVPLICTSSPGFDRKAFHDRFDRSVVSFFQHALRIEANDLRDRR